MGLGPVYLNGKIKRHAIKKNHLNHAVFYWYVSVLLPFVKQHDSSNQNTDNIPFSSHDTENLFSQFGHICFNAFFIRGAFSRARWGGRS
jgi:hypothetical protein